MFEFPSIVVTDRNLETLVGLMSMSRQVSEQVNSWCCARRKRCEGVDCYEPKMRQRRLQDQVQVGASIEPIKE